MPSLKTAFKPTISLSQCLIEPSLFGSVFAGPSFWTWRTLGKVIDCLSLTEPREMPIAPPTLFSTRTGETLVGPQASPAGAARTPREIAMSPTPAPPGYNRPSYLEPWFPYVTGMIAGPAAERNGVQIHRRTLTT